MNDGRITKKAPYGRHIALTCKNHPDKRWSTKNIGHIGARTIFYDSQGEECSCPASDLRVVPTEGPDVEP